MSRRTVLNSRSQLWTTVLGAMIRHVGQVLSAGGSSFRSRHALRSCNLDTCLRRRFLSVTTPCFFIIAERNDITWIVLPVFDQRIVNSQEKIFNGKLTLCKGKKLLCIAWTWKFVSVTNQSHVISKKSSASFWILPPQKFYAIPLIITKICIYWPRNLDSFLSIENESLGRYLSGT